MTNLLSGKGWLKSRALRTEPVTLPTFICSRPSSRPPPNPAGADTCSEFAWDQWHRDAFRYAPYCYEWRYGVESPAGWRLVCADEKEVVMGFPVGYTRAIDRTNAAKAKPQEF